MSGGLGVLHALVHGAQQDVPYFHVWGRLKDVKNRACDVRGLKHAGSFTKGGKLLFPAPEVVVDERGVHESWRNGADLMGKVGGL